MKNEDSRAEDTTADAHAASCAMCGLKRALMEFVRLASTELSPHEESRLAEIAPHLPAGGTVYVTHTPKASLEDVVRIAATLQELGFVASPHIAARRVPSEMALKKALRSLREHGVEQALLVAGDLDRPIGPFTSTLEVIGSGALEEAAFKRIGVAGHPEGHHAISPERLLAALHLKQAFGRRTGVALHIVTQFGFNPDAVCEWSRRLRAEGVLLPIHVGIAGPTSLSRLLKFTVQCGVGASMRSAARSKGALGNLSRLAGSPDQMLLQLVRWRASHPGSQLVQPHIYAFGGALATARWLRAIAEGRYAVPGRARL